MEANSSNIDKNDLVVQMLNLASQEVPAHLSENEEVLFEEVLKKTFFKSINYLVQDLEAFLNEELDFKSITSENISKINFSALATKFGKRYGFAKFKSLLENRSKELEQLGWKIVRVILIKVVQPQLSNITTEEAQFFVTLLEEEIISYAIILDEEPDKVLNKLHFWSIFKKYQFTLELDGTSAKEEKKLPPMDEYIRWNGTEYTVEQAGYALEIEFSLIADKTQWIQFFKDHRQRIEVLPGQLNRLIAVLHQMEYNGLINKTKKKGCWKIWQVILIDQNENNFHPELHKISSRINGGKNPKSLEEKEFGEEVIKYMMAIEKNNS